MTQARRMILAGERTAASRTRDTLRAHTFSGSRGRAADCACFRACGQPPYHHEGDTIELIRNGRIGQLQTIIIGSAMSHFGPNQPEQPVADGFDYEMWLGPAPWVPYTYERCTPNWTLIYD
jgi:hypothetical protein